MKYYTALSWHKKSKRCPWYISKLQKKKSRLHPSEKMTKDWNRYFLKKIASGQYAHENDVEHH